MGRGIYIYRNSYTTLYDFLRAQYPTIREWALSYRNPACGYYPVEDLTDFSFTLIDKIGAELPPPEQVSRLSQEELDHLRDLTMLGYEDYLTMKKKEHLSFIDDLPGLQSPYLTDQFTKLYFLEGLWGEHQEITNLIHREYTLSEASPNSYATGYWTPEECQYFKQLFQGIVDESHKDYLKMEHIMTRYFQEKNTRAKDLPDFLKGIRLLIQCLLNNLNECKENEGIIGAHSC